MAKSILGIILAWIISILLIISGLMKVTYNSTIIKLFSELGLSNFVITIGLIEIGLAILFIIPRTSKIGAFFLSAFFGGAIATHITNNQTTLAGIPLIFLLVTLVTTYLKDPKTFYN